MIFSDYKPLQNYVQKQFLFDALYAVWISMRRYSVIGSRSIQLDKYPTPWELELLAREAILNCSGTIVDPKGRRGKFNIEKAVNHIRRIDEALSKKTIASFEAATSKLHALIHQQATWQDDLPFDRISRYVKLMTYGDLRDIAEKFLGISVADFYKIGLSISGLLEKQPYVLSTNYALTPGISPEAEKVFFNLVAGDRALIRDRIMQERSYESNWAYTYNPLRGKPLIFDSSAPEYILGISSTLLFWRITEGLYYDIFKMKKFSDAWGDAYCSYIGDVLKETLASPSFVVRPETAYRTGDGDHHGTDWLVSDSSAHVFVECKTKRLNLNSKWSTDNSSLTSDLEILAEGFFQNYKNINEALNGLLPQFDSNNLPVFSVVVTLENWRTDSLNLSARLASLIRERVAAHGLPISIIDRCPYILLSAQEFEIQFQAVAERGLYESFKDGARVYPATRRPLFPHVLAELMPDIADKAGLRDFAV